MNTCFRKSMIFWIMLITIGCVLSIPHTGQAQSAGYPLPDFELPYYKDTGPYWSGGPHKWGKGPNVIYMDLYSGSGLDFSYGGKSFDVSAMAEGDVVYAGTANPDNGLGTQVAIKHKGGSIIIYGHLENVWQPILDAREKNELYHVLPQYTIGRAGKTGNTNKVHLHIELRDGTDECCENGHIGGNPISWHGLVLNGYRISDYRPNELGINPENPTEEVAYNYDGLAVKVSDLPAELGPFPYEDFSFYDYLGQDSNNEPIYKKRTDVYTLLPSNFVCADKNGNRLDDCESIKNPNVEFSGHGHMGGGGILNSDSTIPTDQPQPTNSGLTDISIAEVASVKATEKFVESMVFTPDGSRLVVETPERIRVFAVPELEIVSSVEMPEWERINIGTISDSEYITALQSTVQIRDVETSAVIKELYPCQNFSQCDPWVFNANSSRGAVVATIDSPERLATAEAAAFAGGGYSTSRMAQHPAPKMIVIFDMDSGKILQTFDISDLYTNSFQAVTKLSFSQDGSLIAVEISGPGITIWKIESGQRLIATETRSGWSLNPDNSSIALNGSKYIRNEYSQVISIVSLENGKETDFADHEWIIPDVFEFTPDGNFLVAMYANSQTRSDRFIRLWDADSIQEVASVATEKPGSQIAINPNSSLIAVAFEDGTVKLFRIE